MAEKTTTTRRLAASKRRSTAKRPGPNLVIVESPAKARTIGKYLGPGYEVQASMGHVRDLPDRDFGVDLQDHYRPTYKVISRARKLISDLKKRAAKAENVFLATDLDREGEAIAWHLTEALGLPGEKVKRVVFNEITETAIKHAFANARRIDADKVNAQQTRRILDRIVGYQLSPLLWRKVARGLSAGRVQSVAVRLIVEREDEIRAFVPEEFWRVTATLTTRVDQAVALGDQWSRFLASAPDPKKGRSLAERAEWLIRHQGFRAELVDVAGRKLNGASVEQVSRIAEALGFRVERIQREPWEPYREKGLELIQLIGRTAHDDRTPRWQVSSIQTRRTTSRPPAPFTTATLQQAAANELRFPASRTMRIAQSLYEGVQLGEEGDVGLITYMRTDSTNLSAESLEQARELIGRDYGPKYVPPAPNRYASGRRAQEAHEAIRPTRAASRPDDVRQYLSEEQYRLYGLIWRRFIASQMTPAQWDATTVNIVAETAEGPANFRATGRVLVFDGFMRVARSNNSTGEQVLPDLREGQELAALQVDPAQRFTQPPPRYTEASLVKTLESEGIGRPSTYATIIQTIQDRGYVEQIDRRFCPTSLGEVVTRKLVDHFPKVMDVAFTAHMEDELDKIEENHLEWTGVLDEFYGPFSEHLAQAKENMVHAKMETEPSPYTCDECGSPMVYRFGKRGRFLSCSKYPECKAALPVDREGKPQKPELTEHKCPSCGKPMIRRVGRFGPFLGCSDYPTCKTIQRLDKQGNPAPPKPPPQPTGVKCQKCGGELVIRQSKRGPFLSCGKFPKCRNIVSVKLLEELKELQDQGKWPPETLEQADVILGRKKTSAKTAKAAKKATASKKKTTKTTRRAAGTPAKGKSKSGGKAQASKVSPAPPTDHS